MGLGLGGLQSGGTGGGGLVEPVTFEEIVTYTIGSLKSTVADGGSAVAFILNTSTAYSTAGSKLLSLRNNGTEKAYFDKDGTLTISGTPSGGTAINIANSFDKLMMNGQWMREQFGSFWFSTHLQSGGNVGLATNSYLSATAGDSTRVYGAKGDGATSVAIIFDNIPDTFVTAGAKLISIRNNGTEKAHFTKDGKLGVDATDATGTPGSVTINKPSGQVAVANGATSVTVTNSCVSATSVVLAVLQDNTDAIQVRSVVPGSGTFTINLTGATTAARNVGFIVFN